MPRKPGGKKPDRDKLFDIDRGRERAKAKGKKKLAKPPAPPSPPPPGPPSLPPPPPGPELPPHISKFLKGLTVKQFEKGAYLRKVVALFAPMLQVESFRSLLANVQERDPRSIRDALETLGILKAKEGFSFNQTIQQTSISNRRSIEFNNNKEIGSFEEITRLLKDEREKHKALPAGSTPILAEPVFIPTDPDQADNEE